MSFTEKIVVAKISAKVMNSFKVMQFIYNMKSTVVALFSVQSCSTLLWLRLVVCTTAWFHLFSRAKPNAPAEKDSIVDGEDAKQTLEFKEESSNGDKEEEKEAKKEDEVKKEDVKTEAKPAGRVIDDAFLLCTTSL